MRRSILLGMLLLGFGITRGNAQSASTLTLRDTIYHRARKLVSEGNGAAGRAVVDSLLRQSTDGTAAYGDALYWRGALAETAADAERDYRRVIVEYPISLYADDALLALVELEQARGDRTGALQHLQRFVREHPVNSAARAVAALAAARLAFDQRDTRIGCAMITEARASASPGDVEMHNQIDYFGNRCTTEVATTASARVTPAASNDSSAANPRRGSLTSAASAPPALSANSAKTTSRKLSKNVAAATDKGSTRTVMPDTLSEVATEAAPDKPATKPAGKRATNAVPPQPATTPPVTSPAPTSVTAKPRGSFTIQLAAYNTRSDAERLVAKLKAQGVTARVSGASRPFRVRLDFYATRQEAQDEVSALKQRGIIGFVTTEQPPAESKTP